MGLLTKALGLVLLLTGIHSVYACNIPVFRYALERWPAEPYDAIVFRRGPLQPEALAAIQKLKSAGDAHPTPNVQYTEVDVDQPLPEDVAELWKSFNNPPLPLLAARCPPGPRAPPLAFSGPLNAANVAGLLDSPSRRELAKRLLAGDSAVWLVLKSGQAAQDAAAHKLLEDELKGLEKELKLPEQDPDGGPMARPVADLPLRLSFSILSISRGDAAERVFIQMLLSVDKALAAEPGVIAFPVFGRARLLCAIQQKDLTQDAITEVAEFITGACSCQVKELNPGTDLLLAADWDALLEGRVVQEPAPPVLTGITAATPGPTPAPALAPPSVAVTPPVRPAPGTAVLRNVLVAAGALFCAVLAASILLKLRAGRRRD